jgi:mitofilin
LSHPAAESNLNHQEIVSIKSNLEMIRQSAPENEFIQKVLASVPENALDSGVWTEPDLKARFYKLKKICSRVALIGKDKIIYF